MDAAATARVPPEEALRPRRLRRRKPLRFRPWLPGAAWSDVLDVRPHGGRLRAVRRIALALALTLLAMPVQALLLLLPGRGRIVFPRLYWAGMCRAIGLKVRVVGRPAAERPVLFLSNHCSWLDILVLGGVLEACFVAKSEVGTWPLVSTVARLGRTVFVSRSRGRTGTEAEQMRARLAAGDSLILFPEGTSSDGTRVLPFRSSFLAVADAARQVQPVSVVYDRLGGLPACRRDRPFFAWYGDMDIATHLWRLARRSGARATVLLHEPVDPRAFPDRKALTAAVAEVVAEGAAALRQNRPVAPLRPAPPLSGRPAAAGPVAGNGPAAAAR
ncbi:lysophospholipid acyltransferase family protein [Caldovatus aquaticus]|uniref:1-acyl-sn-glycerol-3-phosphate acyltransferase n=1 Tax=Caldovatus aquaticus TaxID=2865671 RepID=A0ABS7F265_9PROT|nr:lysophospholipid acyltransferase family protein [Caldovatus aquaticus]MBW8269720.1 1-acyl-sn-glycerol-3-phosphate acyltransferase [Caldovatus aquaticus]